MGIEGVNQEGAKNLSNVKYRKIEPTTIDIDASVFDVRSFDGVRATGKRKELLDFITDHNPDGVISDELEAYIFQNLMTDEERIKMPDANGIDGEGILKHEEKGFRSIGYKNTDEYSEARIWRYRRADDKALNSWTYLKDEDKDGYADSLYMLFNEAGSAGKEMSIDFNSDFKYYGTMGENMVLE